MMMMMMTSAALLHNAAAAAEMNLMKNSPEQRINTGANDSATSAAAVLRLRSKSHCTSGNTFSPLLAA